MSRKTIQLLAAIVVGLVLLMLVMQSSDQDAVTDPGRQLLPGFEDLANGATEVRIALPDGIETLTIRRDADAWVITSKNNYAADVGKLRQLIVALSEARIVEDKTSNPENYARLGVGDPDDGGQGSKVEITGADFSYAVILGNTAQRDFRYARIPGKPESYLIDRSPEIPQSSNDWLMSSVIDISADRVKSVSITHSDGESIVIGKSSQDEPDFTVLDIPEGRELSYSSVGNGIAGALSNLDLQDVRAHVEAPIETTVVYRTWDGLEITAAVASDDETSWVAFAVNSVADASGEDPADASANQEAGASATDGEAERLMSRLSGWQYEVPGYKNNLLIRRWEDLLKAP